MASRENKLIRIVIFEKSQSRALQRVSDTKNMETKKDLSTFFLPLIYGQFVLVLWHYSTSIQHLYTSSCMMFNVTMC